jgi:hypothetical protein
MLSRLLAVVAGVAEVAGVAGVAEAELAAEMVEIGKARVQESDERR